VLDIATLMNISEKLALLNHARYKDWSLPFTMERCKPAIYAFKGDVYEGLEVQTIPLHLIESSQKNFRILSGLYGVLRPLDLILPYRLEMGIKLNNPKGKNLYIFWEDIINRILQEDLLLQEDNLIVNLASKEYFSVINPKKINGKIITPRFLDGKNGQYRMISFYAKRARGLMAKWILNHQPRQIEELRLFNSEGYHFDTKTSTDSLNPIFMRP
ncbi:MAG: peroxide stress protein YaaA, partial [Pseudomonadota bacterium]|nr:peroxide stress protein YaaA [Pseudomonadota bacterium]